MQKKITLRSFKAVLLILLSFSLVFSCFLGKSVTVSAAVKTQKIKGKYYQTDARKMLSMINSFRTGKEAWYYKKEGSTKKVKLNDLNKLKYDYTLEKIAMQRAAELSVRFEHTRPDGSSCFTAFPSGYHMLGENIAMGTASYMTTKNTLNLWKETKESYNGQGHRRNMLEKGFTCVGIACFEVGGTKYWVQEFGSPRIGTKKTDPVNKVKTVKVKVQIS